MNRQQTRPLSPRHLTGRSSRILTQVYSSIFERLPSVRLVILMVFAIFLGVFGLAPVAKAVQNLEITAPQIRVYSKPDLLSPLLTVLKKGSTVLAANEATGQFRKVLVKDAAGAKKVGFVSLAELKGTKVPSHLARGRRGYALSKNLHHKWSVGLLLGLNYQTEGATTYTDGQGGSANVGALSGSAFMFGAFVDIPWTQRLNIEAFLLYKPTSGTATASPNSSVVGTATQTIILAENFISIGAAAKWYNSPLGAWWYGGGLELDHGSSGTLQYGSQTAITLQSLPNLFMVFATTGYDMSLGGHFFFVPKINLGLIFNTSPPIIEVDALANIIYAF